MAIYLVDYENVYIEGLTGLERLKKTDEVVIFYTQNRCGLTFELHRRLISCRAVLRLMEVTALSTRKNTVKNALDLQLSMYIGYLVGSRPKEPLYIISKDTDFDLDLTFFAQYLQEGGASLSICATIENALDGVSAVNTAQMLEEAAKEATQEEQSAPAAKKKNGAVVVFSKALRARVKELLETEDKQVVNRICAILTASEDLLSLNNLLSRYYHDGKQVKEIYHKLKPSFNALRELTAEQ
ncbi:PIN domain-containing protein [Ruminococcus sp.]|uniref:PIN domain-containing protein n=1 Tax=Ruminococcus sp. TaxID=41978 RepID=UPI0025FCEF42|nr:PIN domain-containing protein [Ruminococcus sp.]